MENASILELYLNNAKVHGSRTAALVKRRGAYQPVTWDEMARDSQALAAGLVALGFESEQRACILATTRLEWVLADMGIIGAGGTTVPIYPSSLAEECQYIIEHSEAAVVFAEDAEQVQKLRAERTRLTGVRKVVQIDGVPEGDDWVIGFKELQDMGRSHVDALQARRAGLNRDSLLTIIYTSGTTGRPKGVMLTHANMLYQADVTAQLGIATPEDVQLFFLPLAHVFAKVIEITWLSTRHVLAFAEGLDTIRENLSEVRPTVMCGVPRIFEKFYQAVVKKGTFEGGLKAQLFTRASELSHRNGEAESAKKTLPWTQQLQFAILKKLVFEKVGQGLGQTLGGRMRLMVSGGAPLSPKVNWFFRDAGLTILEGYGLTETSAGAFVNRDDANRIGTVGQVLPGTEGKIAADGEVLIRGPGIMRGYWQNPDATHEVIDSDGWFHTGDVGVIDGGGFLRITDRKKDLIVTAGGKNVAPQNIENLVKTHKLISQVVVHGDKRKYLTALVTLDADALSEFAQGQGLGNGSYAELTQRPEVFQAVEVAIDGFNGQLASYETIKKFKVLEHDFSQATGELTPTLKVKRKVVNERYRDVFNSFYEEAY